MVRFFGNLYFFGAPFLLIGMAIVLFFWVPVFGHVDPQKVDRANLVRMLQLRDFKTFNRETLAAITNRCESEFGRNAVQPPHFEFTDLEKKVYRYFQKKRSENTAPSNFETNMLLMARTRYFQWMKTHETLTTPQKRVFMDEVAADLKYWQILYLDFLRAANLPMPSLMQLIQEFEDMIEGFKADATQEEIDQIDRFKQQINVAVISRELRGTNLPSLSELPENVSAAFSSVLGSFLSPPKKQRQIGQIEDGKNTPDTEEKEERSILQTGPY